MDSEGSELGYVPVVLRKPPLGTYLGWNVGFLKEHLNAHCTETRHIRVCSLYDSNTSKSAKSFGRPAARLFLISAALLRNGIVNGPNGNSE